MKCPGQDMQYWKPGDIFEADCPQCGSKIEFFKDEATRKCKGCGAKVMNPKMDFGCASYCQFAAECLGDLAPDLIAKRADLFKDRVAVEVKRLLGLDFQRIAHAVRVARNVEGTTKEERVGPATVLCAAYLHTLGEPGDAPNGLPDARNVLEGLGASPDLVTGVTDLLEHLRQGDADDSPEARILLEAHQKATMEETGSEQPL